MPEQIDTEIPKLNAKNLKDALWRTLNEIRSGEIPAANADAIASQSREILRTVNTQLRVLSQAKQSVTMELAAFAGGEG